MNIFDNFKQFNVLKKMLKIIYPSKCNETWRVNLLHYSGSACKKSHRNPTSSCPFPFFDPFHPFLTTKKIFKNSSLIQLQPNLEDTFLVLFSHHLQKIASKSHLRIPFSIFLDFPQFRPLKKLLKIISLAKNYETWGTKR